MAIGFLLTLRCDARCRHCGVNAGPHRSEEIGTSDCLRWLDEARAFGGISEVAFAGGEPFLYPDLDKVVGKAGSFAQVQILTNGGWATTRQIAKDRLARLADFGLTTLSISADTYHQEFVPVQNVKNALIAASEVGIKNLRLQSCGPSNFDGLRLRCHITRTVEFLGRAREIPGLVIQKSPIDFFERQDGRPGWEGCPHWETPFLCITTSGDVWHCDASYIRCRDKMSPVALGNAHSTPIGHILGRLRYDPLLRSWQKDSWRKKLEVVRRAGLGHKLQPSYQSPCDLCADLLNDPDLRDVLEKFYSS